MTPNYLRHVTVEDGDMREHSPRFYGPRLEPDEAAFVSRPYDLPPEAVRARTRHGFLMAVFERGIGIKSWEKRWHKLFS